MTHPPVDFLEDALAPHLPPPDPVPPVVEVAGCRECPMARSVGYSRHGLPVVDCRLAGTLALRTGGAIGDGCPLRSGPVTLRLIDRGRP